MTNAKNNAKTNDIAHIELKMILRDIERDIKRDRKIDMTLDDRKIRSRLRLKYAKLFNHEHNQSWKFTQSQRDIVYDDFRSMHDRAYVETIARREKRNAKTNDATTTKRVRASRAKRDTTSNDVVTTNEVANVD